MVETQFHGHRLDYDIDSLDAYIHSSTSKRCRKNCIKEINKTLNHQTIQFINTSNTIYLQLVASP